MWCTWRRRILAALAQSAENPATFLRIDSLGMRAAGTVELCHTEHSAVQRTSSAGSAAAGAPERHRHTDPAPTQRSSKVWHWKSGSTSRLGSSAGPDCRDGSARRMRDARAARTGPARIGQKLRAGDGRIATLGSGPALPFPADRPAGRLPSRLMGRPTGGTRGRQPCDGSEADAPSRIRGSAAARPTSPQRAATGCPRGTRIYSAGFKFAAAVSKERILLVRPILARPSRAAAGSGQGPLGRGRGLGEGGKGGTPPPSSRRPCRLARPLQCSKRRPWNQTSLRVPPPGYTGVAPLVRVRAIVRCSTRRMGSAVSA